MRTLTIFAGVLLAVSCALAAPAKPVLVEVLEEEERVPPVPILKQINEVHDDGSYTFGYEAGDGSFRVETKDPNGHVKGKYGYIDEFGQQQVLEYNTGKSSGRSLGFQTGGSLAPFPIVLPSRSVSTPEQHARDYEYSSTDEDEDGMPDYKQHNKPTYKQSPPHAYKPKHAEYSAPAKQASYDSYDDSYGEPAPAPVVHVEPVIRVAPAPIVRVAPAPVVRVAPAPVVAVAPAPQLVRVAAAPVAVPVFQPQFQPARGQPVAIANPDAQFFEDLANDSIDANQDGEPDRAIGVFQQQAPLVFAPPPGAPFFDGRRF